jgi:hypothetical protein
MRIHQLLWPPDSVGDSMKETVAANRFNSRLARFRDTHDLTAFEDQIEALNLDSAEAVRKLAEERGIAETELIPE